MAVTIGEQFECMVTSSEQVRLHTDNVKALLDSLLLRKVITQEEAESCFQTIPITTVKTNRKDASLKPKWVAPTLGPNATINGIIDDLGAIREKIAADKKTEGFLKVAYQTRLANENPAVDPSGIPKTTEEAGFSLFDNSNTDNDE